MSSSVEGATAARIPSHANGNSRTYSRSTPAGIASRETPWNPSHPPMKSHATS